MALCNGLFGWLSLVPSVVKCPGLWGQNVGWSVAQRDGCECFAQRAPGLLEHRFEALPIQGKDLSDRASCEVYFSIFMNFRIYFSLIIVLLL